MHTGFELELCLIPIVSGSEALIPRLLWTKLSLACKLCISVFKQQRIDSLCMVTQSVSPTRCRIPKERMSGRSESGLHFTQLSSLALQARRTQVSWQVTRGHPILSVLIYIWGSGGQRVQRADTLCRDADTTAIISQDEWQCQYTSWFTHLTHFLILLPKHTVC